MAGALPSAIAASLSGQYQPSIPGREEEKDPERVAGRDGSESSVDRLHGGLPPLQYHGVRADYGCAARSGICFILRIQPTSRGPPDTGLHVECIQ